MSKLKLTKTELKHQQDALKQYLRFLPTLQLKKQQLQLEARRSRQLVLDNRQALTEKRAALEPMIALFGPAAAQQLIAAHLKVEKVHRTSANVAGVSVPVFDHVEFFLRPYDLFATPWWVDRAIAVVRDVVGLLEAGKVLEEQYRLLASELRSTNQRVNLFEKVKIPECRENIRKIQIAMGDERTSAVVRSKIAQRKMQEAAA